MSDVSKKRAPARLLAIETADRHGSIAAATVSPEGVIDNCTSGLLRKDQRSAQSLAPAIAELLGQIGWEANQLDLIAVARGPGSFTGLRIGVTTAKALAYAAGARLIGVSTLSALAESSPAAPGRIVTAIDAYRAELFTGIVGAGETVPAALATRRLPRADLAGILRPGDRVISPIADDLAQVAGSKPEGVEFLTAEPTAEAVARLAAVEYAADRTRSPFDLAIDYCRASAAEEKIGAEG